MVMGQVRKCFEKTEGAGKVFANPRMFFANLRKFLQSLRGLERFLQKWFPTHKS